MRPLLLALCLAVTLTLAACGGGEKTKTVTAGAKTVTTGAQDQASAANVEEDKAAIKKLMTAFGDAVGTRSCDFFTASYLAELGGRTGCHRTYTGTTAASYRVDEVTVDGDTGTATLTKPGEKRPSTFPVARVGEPSDPYDGWKISGQSTRAANTGDASTGEPLSKEEFIAKGDALCAEFVRAQDAAVAATGSIDSLAKAAQLDESLIPLREKFVAGFEALQPPEDAKELMETLLDRARKGIVRGKARLAAARKGDRAAFERAQAGALPRTPPMSEYGFKECGPGKVG